MRNTLALSAVLAAAVGLLATLGAMEGAGESRPCRNSAPGGIVALTQCPGAFAHRAPAPTSVAVPVVVAQVGDLAPAH